MAEGADGTADRILTVPNALSALRLAGVPFFLWLLLGPEADGWAVAVIAASGFTDWLDGVLARKLNQQSRIGAMLDPAVDRLYILATLVGLVLRDIIPLWLVIVIVGRDAILAVALAVLRKHGYGPPEVHYLGKAATFCLLYAFPLLLLGSNDGDVAYVAKATAWGFTIWGTALYLYAGAAYLVQVTGLIRGARRIASGRPA
ncbi:MAG TPA: CDP-alcohol phosphatidyltransferase family protein [Jatrophihabitantaceae bacterium]|nr:CDP-alcohol phosphatidyltransferase family protein [Jatrophihabitantaceae bacterium]